MGREVVTDPARGGFRLLASVASWHGAPSKHIADRIIVLGFPLRDRPVPASRLDGRPDAQYRSYRRALRTRIAVHGI